MNRREALRRILVFGSGLLVPVLGRNVTQPAYAAQGRDARVDSSFARAMAGLVQKNDVSARARLLEHPALDAILRHQRMTGNRATEPSALLDQMLETARRARSTTTVLDAWDGRHRDLLAFATDAAHLLPASWEFSGTVFLIMGYDIGLAAPPDGVLNVVHEHFCRNPEDLGFYATHEAHHLGYLALRPLPVLLDLDQPARLREIVRYMTHLEGMGVHAAYPSRRRHGSLTADDDYSIYLHPGRRRQVIERYAGLAARMAGLSKLPEQEVGQILNGMSSGDRLWYQFGALAAWTLERSRGHAALVDSILNPDEYFAVAEELLTSASADGSVS